MTWNFILIGGGDFSVEVVTYLCDFYGSALAESWLVSDIVSPSPPRIEALSDILGYAPTLHTALETVDALASKKCLICIGSASDRLAVLTALKAAGAKMATLIHPTAYVASSATLGAGSIICPFAFVGPFARVEENCVLNVRSVVGHDAIVGCSTVLSPGADINGHACTGRASFLGAGAIMNPKSQLGAFSKLSAGSVLTQIVGDGFLMHGNPAKGRQMMKV